MGLKSKPSWHLIQLFEFLVTVYVSHTVINILIMAEPKSDVFNSFKIAIVSSCGNWLGDTLLYPLDTISTRLKASKHFNHDPINFAISTIKEDKLKLFRGVQLSFPAVFIPSLVYLTCYDLGMKYVSHYVHKHFKHEYVKLAFPFFVSSSAQFVALFTLLPVDVVRTRIQINRPEFTYRSFPSALTEIWRKEGFSRFFKASKIYFVSKTLFAAIQFQTFEMIRYFAGPSHYWMILNTIISTATAVTVLNPLEVLITRYALVDTTKKRLEFSLMIRKIFKGEGIRGFYKGYATQLMYNCCFALFWLPLYQIVREKFGVEDQD